MDTPQDTTPQRPYTPLAWPARRLCAALWVGVWLWGSSCSSYNDKTAKALGAFQAGQLEQAEQTFADVDVTGSTFLSGAEAGTVALAAGRFDAAVEHFTRAAESVKDVERQGLLDPGSLGRGLAGLALNEGAKTYSGEGYERALLHTCLGLAYLAQGLVQDLFVEVQLAGDLLAAEEELYQVDYGAGGLAHLVSALAYELREEPDQAYIDWQALAEKNLALELAGPSLVRLARRLNRPDDLARWLQRFGEPAMLPEEPAQVILIAGVGLGPYKREARLDVPTGNGLLSWSVPRFTGRSQGAEFLQLTVGDLRATSVVVEDVGRIAEKNLSDRITALTLRSTARAFGKRELTRELEKKHGSAGALAGNLFSLITERADLRTWTTLPDTWQTARAIVPAGVQSLRVSAGGSGAIDLGRYELLPGETLFILARTVGARLFAHPVGGRALDGAAAASDPVETL